MRIGAYTMILGGVGLHPRRLLPRVVCGMPVRRPEVVIVCPVDQEVADSQGVGFLPAIQIAIEMPLPEDVAVRDNPEPNDALHDNPKPKDRRLWAGCLAGRRFPLARSCGEPFGSGPSQALFVVSWPDYSPRIASSREPFRVKADVYDTMTK